MRHHKLFQEILLAITLASTLLLIITVNYSFAQTEGDEASTSQETNVVRDSPIVLLEGKVLAGNDFIHLYDSTPYMIMNGHVAAKLPCDNNSESPIKVLIGSAPNLTAADMELVSDLSSPGVSCLYHADLESVPGGNVSNIVTDIAIQNPTGDQISFGSTDSVVIGINEIAKGSHEESHSTNEAADEGAEASAEHAEEETGEHAQGEGQVEEDSGPADDTN